MRSFSPQPQRDLDPVEAVVDQVEAWHDRAHASVAGTFALCMHEPCANVRRAAQSRRHPEPDREQSAPTTAELVSGAVPC